MDVHVLDPNRLLTSLAGCSAGLPPGAREGTVDRDQTALEETRPIVSAFFGRANEPTPSQGCGKHIDGLLFLAEVHL
jgi:hypothetical protein